MNKILDVVEDIKQKITDNEYKIIMDSLMEINKTPLVYENHISSKFICLFRWLDTKIQMTNCHYDTIKRSDIYKFIISEYYNHYYYENINFVKIALKIFFMYPTKEQDHNQVFKYVKYIT